MEADNSEKNIIIQKEQNEQINKIIPLINNKENNLEIILMEKDKEIINLSENISKLNKDLENISNELKDKDMEISTLKSDISTINNEKKLYEEELQNNQAEIAKLTNIIKEKDKKIEELNSNNDLSNKKYINLIEDQKNETIKMSEQCLKLQNEINELNAKLMKKDRDFINLENILYKSREKDNQIFILKKDIKEKENSLKEIQNKLISANNELQTSKNFKTERMKQFYSYSNTNNNSNSKIISFVVNKIQNLILFVDSDNNFDESNKDLIDNIVELKEDYVLYDLLEQNISILKSKIFNKYNKILKENKENNNKYQILMNKNEELKKNLLQMKNSCNEQNEYLKQNINQLQNSLQLKEEEIKKLNNKNSSALSQNLFNKLYSKIITKLSKNYLKDINLDYQISDKNDETKINDILNIIDFLVEKLNNLNNFIKEYESYKIKVNDVINNKLNKSNVKNDEVSELKNNIQELNTLLIQSNNYLSKTREENSLLKKRILNLEKSINMISKNNLKRNNESNYLMTYNNDNNYRSNPFLED